jgi:hypothetical protein
MEYTAVAGRKSHLKIAKSSIEFENQLGFLDLSMVDKKLIPVIARTKSYFRLNNWNETICLHIKVREFTCQPYLSIFNAIIGELLHGIQQQFNGF